MVGESVRSGNITAGTGHPASEAAALPVRTSDGRWYGENVRTPVRAVPAVVERAAARGRWLRWVDALLIWFLAWGGVALAWETATPSASAIVALLAVALGALSGPIRRRWRPVSAVVSLWVSRRLKPGDHAWLVLAERIDPVIVTARRRLRLVVASPHQRTEGVAVRRTRILVVPSWPPGS